MKFLDIPSLAMLTAYLSGKEVGDFVLIARIEAYSCKRAGAPCWCRGGNACGVSRPRPSCNVPEELHRTNGLTLTLPRRSHTRRLVRS